MKRNSAKAEFLDSLYSEAMVASDEEWVEVKERIFPRLKSIFRPGLLTDITLTLKTFLGTARWYHKHQLLQFIDYLDSVRHAKLEKLDLGSTVLLDVSRNMDVWAGHQLTQVRHLVVASTRYEKVFDLPIWGTRSSQFLDGSSGYLNGGLFDRQIRKYKARDNKTFLKLNRAYENRQTQESGSAGLWDLAFLLYRIGDFLRLIRAGRFEFLVKEPQHLRAPSLCLYGILTGNAYENKSSTNDAGFIRIDLDDGSKERVFFYLLPEDYSNLLSASNLSVIGGRSIAVLARCRLSVHTFDSPAEIVPRRIWIISNSDFVKAQAISNVRLRLRIHLDGIDRGTYDNLIGDGYACRHDGFYEYTPKDGTLNSIVGSNAFLQKVYEGTAVEDLTIDLREIGRSLRARVVTPAKPISDLEYGIGLVLRAFYPNQLTIGKLSDWIYHVSGEPVAVNEQARIGLLHRAAERLAGSDKNVILIDGSKLRLQKCPPLKIGDDLLSRYLYLLLSIHGTLRIDTLLSQTLRSLGLGRSEMERLELLMDKLVKDDRVSVAKNRITIPIRPPEDIELEDRHESIDNALVNVLRERQNTFTDKHQLFDLGRRSIPDLTLNEVADFLEQHLHSDVATEFGGFAIILPSEEAAKRRRQFVKKHFVPKFEAPAIAELEKSISAQLHRASPSKCTFTTICDETIRLVPNASKLDVSVALRSLCNKNLVIVDKMRKYAENPNPPHLGPKKTFHEELHPVVLDYQQVAMLPSLACAHQSGKIFFIDRSGTRKAFVRSYEESGKILTDLLKKMEKGEITELWYVDHLDAMVRVRSKQGTITGTYDGSEMANKRLRDAVFPR
jgi:hypothetical protein